MKDSQLIRTLQLLEQEELEMLHLFVASPIFQDKHHFEDARRLFEHIKMYYPVFDAQDLDKKEAGLLLFPNRKDPEFDVTRAMSHLMHVVRQFINFRYTAVRGGQTARKNAKEDTESNPIKLLNHARQQLSMLRFYSERLHQKNQHATEPSPEKKPAQKGKKIRKPEHFFQNIYTEIKESLSKPQKFDRYENYEFSDYHYYRYLLEYEKTIFESIDEDLEGDDNLLSAIEELDRFYLLSKLDLMSRLAHRHQIIKPFEPGTQEDQHYHENLQLMMQIVDLVRERGYSFTPSILLYCSLMSFQTQQDPQKADLEAMTLNDLLNQQAEALPRDRMEDFKTLIRSHWVKRYAQSKDRATLERLHQMHREQAIALRERGEPVKQSVFRNMLQVALKLGQTDWANNFLNEFDNNISRSDNPALLADIYWAILRITEGRLKDATRYLPHYIEYGETDDIYLYSIAATTDVKLRYELETLEDDDYGHNMFRATQVRIERAKNLPDTRREERLNFYKAVRKLLAIKKKKALNPKADINIQLKELDELLHKPIVEVEWLEAKRSGFDD